MLSNHEENNFLASASLTQDGQSDVLEVVEVTEIRDAACNEQSLLLPTHYEWDVIKNHGKESDLSLAVQLATEQPVKKTPEYHPNIKDKRVAKRLKEAIGGITGLFNKGSGNHRGVLIDEILGCQSHPLPKWLRNVTLITTDNFYSKAAKKCKTHELNRDGINYLIKLLNGKTNSTWGKYQQEQQELRKRKIDAKLSGINDDNELEEIKRLSNEYALEYCEKKFGESLRNGTISYVEKSDRYWNLLQLMPRNIRDVFLATNGYRYDYDIECCNVTLIMQYANICKFEYKKSNPDKKAPILKNGAILEYMHAKEDIRKQLADEVGVSINQVKKVLTALVNGASVRNCYGYLYKELGPNVSRAFSRNEFICRLVKDIKSCWDCINSYDDRRKTKVVFFKNGNVQLRKEKLSCQQKSKIYFELEKKVIDVVSSYISNCGIGIFKIHDGWVTNNLVDTHELKNLIMYTTSFDVKIKFKLLDY